MANNAETARGTGEIRTIELSREGSSFRAKRPPRSMVAGASGVAPSPVVLSGITEDNGLVLALYNVGSDAQPTDNVHNEGGALILQAQLELVFWGAVWQTASTPSVADVVNAVNGILNSPYLLGLKQYGFQGAAVRGSTIVTSPAPSANYSFDDVGNLVWSLIDDGKFPEPDDDGGRILYMVFMAPGTTPPPNERGAHGDPHDFDLPADVDYAWVGYASYGTLDYITDVFTHEFVEAITDPEPHDPAWVMNRIINGGNEIGDACNNTVDRLDGILVQAYWSERQKACVIPIGQGALASLQSLEEGVRLESGSSGRAYVSLDRRTPIDVTLSLISDNPAVLTIPPSLVIPTGQMDGLVSLQAQPVEGSPQFVSIHASWAGKTVTAQVEITPRPSIIAGVVTDAASRPIARATVLIDNGAVTGGVQYQLLTGDDGSYATATVPPGTYTVDVSASGYVPTEATVVVQEGVPTTSLDFSLEVRRPSTISGTAKDSRQTPIVGADVLLLQQTGYQRLTTVTDNVGGYRLTIDPADYTGAYWFRVTAPGYTEGFREFVIPNGADLNEDFILPKLGSVTGLTTTAGTTPPTPIAGTQVQADIPANDPLIPHTVSTASDATGHYQLQLPPGPTTVTAHAAGFEPYAITLTITADETLNQDLALVPASATLTGTVFDSETGDTLDNAHVAVAGAAARATTNLDGTYTVRGIPAGHAQVTVSAPHHLTQQFGVDFLANQAVTLNVDMDTHPPGPHPP